MDANVVEEIVKWRMGSAYDTPIIDWRDSRLNFDSAAMLDGDLSGGVVVDRNEARISAPPQREEYAPAKHRRVVSSAEDLLAARADPDPPLSVYLAMQDARLFPSMEYIGPPVGCSCIQLSYTRTVSPQWRSGTEVVLWPLTNDFKWWTLPTFSPAPWDHREPRILWRGQPTGMSYHLGIEARPVLPGIRRVRRWLNGWLRDEVAGSGEHFHAWAASYQRLVAASMCRSVPGSDVRLVPLFDGDRRSFEAIERFLGRDAVSERVDKNTFLDMQQRHKYLLSVPGNDVPTSLRQDLLSGSVVLMPRPFWENVWFFGLTPDVHYIPLRADLADLEERLQWCRDNDSLCREIAEAGRAFALQYFDPALEREVQARLASRLARQTLPPEGS